MEDRALLANDVRKQREEELETYTDERWSLLIFPWLAIIALKVIHDRVGEGLPPFSSSTWTGYEDSIFLKLVAAVLACAAAAFFANIVKSGERYVNEKKTDTEGMSDWSDQMLLERHEKARKRRFRENAFAYSGFAIFGFLVALSLLM